MKRTISFCLKKYFVLFQTKTFIVFLFDNLFSVAFFVVGIHCHGRLFEPPSRASMWRRNDEAFYNQFKDCIEPDYNDNQLYCGGKSVKCLYTKLKIYIYLCTKIFNKVFETKKNKTLKRN